jgi:hypothetical protein
MKNLSFFLFIPVLLVFASCANEQPESREPVTKDKEPCLEDILNAGNEQELISRYGKNNVSYDTIWGAEGFYTMGTVVKVDEHSRVEVMWADEAKRETMISATLVSNGDYYGDKIQSGKWKSCTGVALGMSLEELQNINGRPFQFSGFGWDYGGGVISWEGGTLEDKGLAIQLSEGSGSDELTLEENTSVLGDVPVMSDNPVARKLKPRVWSISVAEVE